MTRTLASFTALLLASATLTGCGASQQKDSISGPTANRATAFLVTQARSEDPAVRANCIEALQVSKDPRVLDVIEAGLRDPDWVVRFASAMAAGKRKAVIVRPILATMAIRDDAGSVRAACIYALKRMGDDSRISDLATLIRSPSPSTRANVALVLGMLGDPSAIKLIQGQKNEEDIRVRFEMTAALARLGDEQARKVIVSWAVNRYAEDQWSAMMVCANLPKEVGLSPLLLGLEPFPPKLPANMQNESTAEVRELTVRRQLVAARSLAMLRDGSGAKVALDNLKNPNPGLRALAALALGEMLTQAQAPGLEPLLDDQDDGVKRAAAAAIVNVMARTGN